MTYEDASFRRRVMEGQFLRKDTRLVDLERADFEEPILEMGPTRVDFGDVSPAGVVFVCEIEVRLLGDYLQGAEFREAYF